MNLPEPNFIERDPEKITQEIISLYESVTGSLSPNHKILMWLFLSGPRSNQKTVR